jgi:hypothetical protein
VQNVITGSLLAAMTENLGDRLDEIEEMTQVLCRHVASGASPVA